MSDQSGLLRGRILSFSSAFRCFSVIGLCSNSAGGANPGGGGGGGGAPILGGGGGGGGGAGPAWIGIGDFDGSGVFDGDVFVAVASVVFFSAGFIGVGDFAGVAALLAGVVDFDAGVGDFDGVGVGFDVTDGVFDWAEAV